MADNFVIPLNLHGEDSSAPEVERSLNFSVTDYERIQFEKAVRELLNRETEATKLYEPLPNQMAFHKSQARERMLRGSNRAGKTLAASAEIGWIVSNRHPYINYPKKGRIIAVGRSEEHIGNVMWDKLSREQPNFRRIRDDETGLWRAYRPSDPLDRIRKDESIPMTPLIPQRLIAGEPSWYSKKDDIPKRVKFKTGWEILFFTGGGSPPQGMDVDVVWFDEEIEKDAWYLEMAARLLDRKGRFLWSATAQAGGNQLWNLHLRAMDEAGDESPSITEHPILLKDNPHIDESEKEELARKYRHDPDAYRVRILGEYLITSFHVYPQFSITQHCIQPFEIPRDWCRYMIVDPGSTVCAVLFVAVPPDRRHVYCYDELYIRDCDPHKFGEMIYHKTQGQNFQSFIIDDNGSRRTDTSSGTTVRQVYTSILKEKKIVSRATGYGFELGLSNVQAGLDMVRKWMYPDKDSKDGKPVLQVFFDGMSVGCPHLVDEIQRYYKKRDPKTNLILNEPVQKNNHQCDNLRYAAMHGCRYIKPDPVKYQSNGKKRWSEKRKRSKKKPEGILLGAKGKS